MDALIQMALFSLLQKIYSTNCNPEITTFDYSWSIVSNPKKAETVKAELKNIVAEHSNLALDEIDTAIAAENHKFCGVW